MTLIYDIWCEFSNWIPLSDMIRFSATCKMFRTFQKELPLNLKAGNSILTERQYMAMTWILERIRNNNLLFINAVMSFGKTLLMLESLRRILKIYGGYGVIMIPSKIYRVWKKEVIKHYGKEPKIMFLTTQKHFSKIGFEDKKLKPDGPDLNGYIFIFTTPQNRRNETISTARKRKLIKKCSIFGIDEPHLMPKMVKKISEIEIQRAIWVGATDVKITKPHERISFKISPTIPQSKVTIHMKNNYIEKIKESKSKHIVLFLPNVNDDIKQFIEKLHISLNKRVINYITKSEKRFLDYEKNGGVLVSTMRKIAEGVNINYCEELHIVTQDNITIKTVQQCMGRVLRTSSKMKRIKIHFYTSNVKELLRARIAKINMDGYELKSGYQQSYKIVKNIFGKLTDGEIMLLFCQKITTDAWYKCDCQLKNITHDILAKCLLS